jgi:cell wall-associated NlpC family hydrolase
MPHPPRTQLRSLALIAVLVGAVGGPCAVFALSSGTAQETLVAARAEVVSTPLDDPADRPDVRLTVPARTTAPAPRRAPVRASRARRPLLAPTTHRAAVAPGVVPVSGSLADRVLAEARRHAGAPYAYGAAGPSRFDCSGFTMYVFGRFGISLPHSSSQQAAVTTRVADDQKRPGDLIFTYHGGSIGHVGIYAGGTQMWASVESGDVVRLQSFAGRTYSVGRVG